SCSPPALRAPLHLVEVFGEAVEAAIPEAPVVFEPFGYVLERLRFEVTRTPLRLSTARDEAGPFEHLEVLGNGGEAHLVGRGEVLHRGVAGCETGEDPAARR